MLGEGAVSGGENVEVKERADNRCSERKERTFPSEIDSVNRNHTFVEAPAFQASALIMSLWNSKCLSPLPSAVSQTPPKPVQDQLHSLSNSKRRGRYIIIITVH